MDGFGSVRVVSPVVRRELRSVLDEDVLAARRAVQVREERFALNRAFVGARRDAAAEGLAVEPTSWMLMSESERAVIRPARRRTPAGLLVLVRGDGSAVSASGAGEVA